MVRMLCVGVFVVCLSTVRADEKKEAPEIALLKARLEAQAKELEALRKRVDELENARTKLILEKETALREALCAANAEKLARSTADDYAKKIEALTAKLAQLKGPNAEPREKPPLAVQARGLVVEVKGEFVLVNIGIDVGLDPGTVLEVVRTDGKNETLLGTLTITKSVYPKEAVGSFTPAGKVPLAKLKPEELPRKGDTVRSKPAK